MIFLSIYWKIHTCLITRFSSVSALKIHIKSEEISRCSINLFEEKPYTISYQFKRKPLLNSQVLKDKELGRQSWIACMSASNMTVALTF